MKPPCPRRPLLHRRRVALCALLGAACLPVASPACSAHAVATTRLASELGLPKDTRISQAWRCEDKFGPLLVLAAHTRYPERPAPQRQEVVFMQFRHSGSVWKKDWQARDFTPPAAWPLNHPATEWIRMGDFDGDGRAEIFVAYTLPGQVAPPDEGKLLIYYKDQKYTIKGAVAHSPTDFGSRNISSSFQTLPRAVQTQALRLWDQLNKPGG